MSGYTRFTPGSTAVDINEGGAAKPPERSCSCVRVICCLLCALLLLLVTALVTAAVLLIVYRPQPPEFTLENVTITRISVNAGSNGTEAAVTGAVTEAVTAAVAAAQATDLSDSLLLLAPPTPSNNSSPVPPILPASGPGGGMSTGAAIPPVLFLDASFNFSIAAGNPNRVGISYEYVNVTARHNNMLVANTVVPRFHQPPNSNITVFAHLDVTQFPLNVTADPTKGVSIASMSLPLTLDIEVRANADLFRVPSPYVTVDVRCDVLVNVMAQTVESTACELHDVQIR